MLSLFHRPAVLGDDSPIACQNLRSQKASSLRLLSLRGLESLDESRVPNVHHLGVASVIGVHAITVVARAAEAGVLVHHPDWRLGRVLLSCPGGDRGIQLLHLRVEVAHAQGDDLGHLDVCHVRESEHLHIN